MLTRSPFLGEMPSLEQLEPVKADPL